ncbi:MAG: TonB-dependent receptor, partial [Deltaproteobacteria bacterium]|nr:TonB-dependent receptor [Deltaproteobacteria bacterium]
LNYQATDEALLYALVSRGFKAGTFSVLNPPDQLTLDPEYLTSYELGFKTDWHDNRLRLNGAVFYYDYTDQQVNTFFPPNVTLVANAAESNITGAELELLARPIPALTLSGAISYLDAEYDQYLATDANGLPVDVSGNRMPYSPEWKFNFAAQYVFTVGDHGFLTVRGNLNWIDDIYFDHFQNDVLGEDAYTLIDALVRYETAGGRWSFELFGKNLSEEEYYTYKRDALGAVAGIIGAPMTVGFQVVYEH